MLIWYRLAGDGSHVKSGEHMRSQSMDDDAGTTDAHHVTAGEQLT
jgi:hypothetical protein